MNNVLNQGKLQQWKAWAMSILIGLLIALTFRSAVAEINDVPTGSMKPTILEGDRLMINKLAYDLKIPFTSWKIVQWGAPERGEIVVFRSPSDGTWLIKRVIGIPGDLLAMKDNRLFINGKPIDYEPFDWQSDRSLEMNSNKDILIFTESLPGKPHPVMFTREYPSVRSFGPVRIPPEHYFMMGDNRDNSADSRYFGFVPRDRIMGQAIGVFFSIRQKANYRPRWERFFRGLS